MMPKVKILKADISHIKQIAEIEKECIPNGWSQKLFEEVLENQNAQIFSAVCDNKVIGFLNGSCVLDEAEILNVAVLEHYRKCGIAKNLIEILEENLKILGVNTVYLEARESNVAAILLYEKCGYKQNGLRKNYYRSPDENAILMIKSLSL